MADAPSNTAAWRVTLDGRDLTDKMAPRLISLSIAEKRGGEADQLDIVLHDHDGKLAIPKEGAVLRVSIGWASGADVTPGLVDKGSFKVDEAEWSGPPDIITVRARSADLGGSYRVRRETSHKDTTVGAIVRKVAAANGLTAHIAADLAAIPVPVLDQDGKSDMALVRELGRRHDAIATVKDGKLLFSAVGNPTTAGGKAIPGAALTRAHGDRYRYKRVERDAYDGVEARWHDQGAAKRKTVKAGAAKGQGKTKRLKHVYASQADAKAAAEAENRRIQRGTAEFEYKLALGRADLYPDRPITLVGFKPEIDARKWLVSEVTHSIDGSGGFGTSLKLETAA